MKNGSDRRKRERRERRDQQRGLIHQVKGNDKHQDQRWRHSHTVLLAVAATVIFFVAPFSIVDTMLDNHRRDTIMVPNPQISASIVERPVTGEETAHRTCRAETNQIMAGMRTGNSSTGKMCYVRKENITKIHV